MKTYLQEFKQNLEECVKRIVFDIKVSNIETIDI